VEENWTDHHLLIDRYDQGISVIIIHFYFSIPIQLVTDWTLLVILREMYRIICMILPVIS